MSASSTCCAFYVTRFLTNGDRVLIMVTADTRAAASADSAHILCFEKSKVIRDFPLHVVFDPQSVPAEMRPTCRQLIEDRLSLAKAQLDAGYQRKFSSLAGFNHPPSFDLQGPLSDEDLGYLYSFGGFAHPIKAVYTSCELPALREALRPIVSRPIVHVNHDYYSDFAFPE